MLCTWIVLLPRHVDVVALSAVFQAWLLAIQLKWFFLRCCCCCCCRHTHTNTRIRSTVVLCMIACVCAGCMTNARDFASCRARAFSIWKLLIVYSHVQTWIVPYNCNWFANLCCGRGCCALLLRSQKNTVANVGKLYEMWRQRRRPTTRPTWENVCWHFESNSTYSSTERANSESSRRAGRVKYCI